MSKKEIKTYFDNITPSNLSGGGWTPTGTWQRVHGDTKSSVGGKFHMETMGASNGDYNAKVVGYPAGSSTSTTVATAGAPAPSLTDVYDALKAACGA